MVVEGSSVFFSASKMPLPNRGESPKSALSPKNELLSKNSALNKDFDDTTLGASECRTLDCGPIDDGFLGLTTTSSLSSSDSMRPSGDKNAEPDWYSSSDSSMCSKAKSLRGSLRLRGREGALDMATGIPFFLRWVSIVVTTRARLMRDRLAMNFGSLLKRSVWMTYVILVMGGFDGSGCMTHPAMKMSARTLPETGGILSDSTEQVAK